MASFEFLAIIFTGIGLIVSILYYTFTLQNANKTRQAQMFMNIYNRASSKEHNQSRNHLLFIECETLDDFKRLFLPTSEKPVNENWEALGVQHSYYEGLGAMVREGLIPIRYVALLQAGVTRKLWEKYGPFLLALKDELDYQRIASEWEYLYNELMKYIKEHPELVT